MGDERHQEPHDTKAAGRGVVPRFCQRSEGRSRRPPERLPGELCGSRAVGEARRTALSEEGAARLLLEAEGRSREAAASYERAVSLREMVYRVFSAIARGVNPDPSDLDLLSTAHVGTLERHHITETEDGSFGWVRVEGTDDLEEPLWAVVLSATSLLTSGPLDRVKACLLEEGGCGWLFRDASKNKSRRWCAIGDCGTRVNMRRLYARKRAGKTDGGREDQSRPESRAQG